MIRLNSGIKNLLNFLAWAIYIFQKVVSDSVNHADSEDIKILIQFPGKSIFENFAQFLKKRGRHQQAWVFDSQNHSECSTFYADQFHIQNKGYSFDFMSTHAISTPVKSIFGRFFGRYFFPRRAAPYRLVSKDVKFSCASFGLCLKFVTRCAPTQTPTQKFKIEFSIFTSQEIGSSSVSF